MSEIVNTYTHKVIDRAPVIDVEVEFDGGVMITETNSSGIIIFANRKFRETTGYTRDEIVGSPHNINRHPDMPRGVFKGLWQTIKDGKIWHGYVKNRRKDGKFYWVLVLIKPKYDAEGKSCGYIAARKVASKEAIKEMEDYYKALKDDIHIDHKFFACNELI